jgi:hypothetical protein
MAVDFRRSRRRHSESNSRRRCVTAWAAVKMSDTSVRDPQTAIGYYRRCLDFIERTPEGFDESSKDRYRDMIDRLESLR